MARTLLIGAVMLLSACHSGTPTNEVVVKFTGASLVLGPATTDAGIPLRNTFIGPSPNGERGLLLSVMLQMEGRWLQSGGLLCRDSDSIWMSDSVSLTIDQGAATASGAIAMTAGGPADVPGGCRRRTGIELRKFEAITLEASVPVEQFNDLAVWHQCRSDVASSGVCAAGPIDCLDTSTRACQVAAWNDTVVHQVVGLDCLGSGSSCEHGPSQPARPSGRLRSHLELAPDLVTAINAEYAQTGILQIAADLPFSFE